MSAMQPVQNLAVMALTKFNTRADLIIDGYDHEKWFVKQTEDGSFFYVSTKGYNSLEAGVYTDLFRCLKDLQKSIKNSQL